MKKSNKKKQIVSLSIKEDTLKKAKEESKFMKKSLSQFTEDLYEESHRHFSRFKEKPFSHLQQLEKDIARLKEEMLNEMKDKQEDTNNK